MKQSFQSRILLCCKKYNLTPKWITTCYGYTAVKFECDSLAEAKAVESIFHYRKGLWCILHTASWTVTVMDEKEHNELVEKQAEEMAKVNDWWERYHVADEETRKLMACGAIA